MLALAASMTVEPEILASTHLNLGVALFWQSDFDRLARNTGRRWTSPCGTACTASQASRTSTSPRSTTFASSAAATRPTRPVATPMLPRQRRSGRTTPTPRTPRPRAG
ncbi:hypothetical protein FSC37_15140 [Piscinibacter aquaticus]|uniref:Uncharacterized protein n=1 Tax=Piscinibacter aquaticus TaxID=392597 RepID=A0A5C6U4M1_9BURK|nr:hypothetical protein FSC37_15140 [Piscinibacter aquaticus]